MVKRMMKRLALIAAVTAPAPAVADADEPRPQLQADVGLSVAFVAYERPVTTHVAVQVGAGIFGTYFLPWFNAGQSVQGLGVEVRPTWFLRATGRGFYVAPYLRGVGVRGDNGGASGTGLGFTTGVFAGWAFRLTAKLDLRAGAGVQYIRFHYATSAGDADTSTPFVAIDLVLGYRL